VTRFDLGDDDALIELLALAIEEGDPVPGDAVAAAKSVAGLSSIDAELATLVGDTVLEQEVVLFRHDPTTETVVADGGSDGAERVMSFATARLDVSLELQADGRAVAGAITPPAAVAIDLETATGTATTTSDAEGRFRLASGPGPCRLRIHAPGGSIVTPWITR
jgi:hypothetical protein